MMQGEYIFILKRISCKTFTGFRENVAARINQINYVKVHIWVRPVTVIKKNEPLEQMLPSTVEIMPRPFDLYISRMGGPSDFSVARRKTLIVSRVRRTHYRGSGRTERAESLQKAVLPWKLIKNDFTSSNGLFTATLLEVLSHFLSRFRCDTEVYPCFQFQNFRHIEDTLRRYSFHLNTIHLPRKNRARRERLFFYDFIHAIFHAWTNRWKRNNLYIERHCRDEKDERE